VNPLALLQQMAQNMPTLIAELRSNFGQLRDIALETLKHIRKQTELLTFEYGDTGADPGLGIVPRRNTQPPLTLEPTDAASGPIERLELDVRVKAGYTPARGFYANLGETPFQVIEMAVGGGVGSAFTLPAGTTVEIRTFLEKVYIVPIGANPAYYQIRLE
jgi:hypothetical protein